MKTRQEKLKQEIVTFVERNGRSVRTQYINDAVALPKSAVLNDLLMELVAERRLSKSYTFLANGEPDCTYDIP